MKTLYPQQQRSMSILLDALANHRAALDSSETGTGKTVKSIELAKVAKATPLIVAPKAVLGTWSRTAQEQGLDLFGVVNYEMLRTGKTPYGGWNKLGAFVFHPDIKMVVWDEIHKCKANFTKNARMLNSAKGLFNLMLSATPCSDPTEMRSIGYLLGIHNLHNFPRWCLANGCSKDSGKLKLIPELADRTLQNLCQLIYQGGRGHRVTRAEMPEFFKECSIQNEPLDFGDGDKIERLYAEMSDEVESLIERMKRDQDTMGAVKTLRLRQKVELLKVPLMVDMTVDLVGEGNNVVIFTCFTDSARALESKLRDAGIAVGTYLGEDRDADKARNVDDFQHNRLNAIVVNLAAGGAGLDLHDLHGRPRVSLVNLSFNPIDVIQALGRIDRAGSLSPSVQRILIAQGTVEQRVAQIISEKKKKFDTLHSTVTILQPEQPNMSTSQLILPLEIEGLDRPERPAHHPRGPSKRRYFEICPSYVPNESSTPNRAAEKGTRIHNALETGDLEDLNEEERFLAEAIIDAENKVINYFGFGMAEQDLKEIELDCDFGEGYSNYGTADRVLKKLNRALLIDYKTGVMAVDDAEINAQMDNYAIGVFQKWADVNEVSVVLILPAQDEVSFHTFYREQDLTRIRLRHRTIDKRADEGTEVHAVPSVCDFCDRISTCRAWHEVALKVHARYTNSAVDLPSGSLHGSEVDDVDAMGKMLNVARVLEKWIDGVRKKSAEMASMGHTPTGFRAIMKTAARKIPGAALPEVIEALAPLGISVDEIHSCIDSVSVGKLEDIVESRAPRGKKKEAKINLDHTLRDKNLMLGGTETYISLVVDRSTNTSENS
jgi:superfamily II DNA or RNA helicase